jgi:hypothetical protein
VEQEAIDTGNNAWAMIALLALWRRTQDPDYLGTAHRLGDFIQSMRNNSGKFQGFFGGIDEPEGAATQRRFASTEHNLDVYAAFTRMAEERGGAIWERGAMHARKFVEAMWDSESGCYLAGTLDPNMRNAKTGQLPVDVQAWSVLSLPDALTLHQEVLTCTEVNHRTAHQGFSGFDFNNDNDGVWFEGTAQMAVAYAVADSAMQLASLRQELRRAQESPPFGDGRGIAAATKDGVSTGFAFELFRRLHVAATAWNVFAQLGYNPYYQSQITDRIR